MYVGRGAGVSVVVSQVKRRDRECPSLWCQPSLGVFGGRAKTKICGQDMASRCVRRKDWIRSKSVNQVSNCFYNKKGKREQV
jgi:hypothetical protein